MKKKILIIGFIFILVIMIPFFLFIKSISDRAQEMNVVQVDLNQVKDGIYKGSAIEGPCEAVVEVTMRNREIMKIDLLKHEYGLGQKAEKVIEEMLIQQSNKVDAIASATLSSKVIMIAVENALMKGK